MAQTRVHGIVVANANQGYQPLVIKCAGTNAFLVDTVSGTGAITKLGYSKAVEVMQTFGSIVWIGARSDSSFAVVVDGATVNKGTAGTFVELKAALEAVVDNTATVTVTTSSVLNGAGDFTFA